MISIIMPYWNRRPQLINTLNFYRKSAVTDYEFLILDDGSDPEHRIEDLQSDSIHITRTDRYALGVNAAKKYNFLLQRAQGDIFILTSPEVQPQGDVLQVAQQIQPNQYFLFQCWDNNGPRRPELHWCSAITRQDMKELNGFDERYQYAQDYDDDDLIARINHKGMEILLINNPHVFHQPHDKINPGTVDATNYPLYQETLNEKRIRANQGDVL